MHAINLSWHIGVAIVARCTRSICLGILVLLLSPGIAWSQEASAIVPGSRVRITELGMGTSGRRTGTLVTAGADTLVLRIDRGGESVPFSMARISRLEVSQRRKGHTAAGVALGFLAGAGVGALVAAGFCQADSGCSAEGYTPLVAIAWAPFGGAVGMVVGGVIGALHKTDQWEAVPSSRWGVSASPTGRGDFAFALSLKF